MSGSNGWDQHKIDVLNRLDKIEEALEKVVTGQAKIYTKVEVFRAKIFAVVASISIVVSAAISVAAIYFRK